VIAVKRIVFLRCSKTLLHCLNPLAGTSYDSSTDMPSRFTPQNPRLSHRAPLRYGFAFSFCFVMFFARLVASSFRVLMCSPNFLPPTLQQLHLFIANPPINTLCPSPVDMRAALLITVLFTDACRQIALALFLFACGIVLLTIGECWPTSFKAQRFPLYRLTCCRSLHSYRSH